MLSCESACTPEDAKLCFPVYCTERQWCSSFSWFTGAAGLEKCESVLGNYQHWVPSKQYMWFSWSKILSPVFLFWGPGWEPCLERVSWEALRPWRAVMLKTESGNMKNAGLGTLWVSAQQSWNFERLYQTTHCLPLLPSASLFIPALLWPWLQWVWRGGSQPPLCYWLAHLLFTDFCSLMRPLRGPGRLHKPESAQQFTALGYPLLYLSSLWDWDLAFLSDYQPGTVLLHWHSHFPSFTSLGPQFPSLVSWPTLKLLSQAGETRLRWFIPEIKLKHWLKTQEWGVGERGPQTARKSQGDRNQPGSA